jgi:hypothetical protein
MKAKDDTPQPGKFLETIKQPDKCSKFKLIDRQLRILRRSIVKGVVVVVVILFSMSIFRLLRERKKDP